MSIPISVGSGVASVAAEAVGGLQYQQIQMLGKGGSSVLAIHPTGAGNVSPASGNFGVSDDSLEQAFVYSGDGSDTLSPMGGAMYVFNRTDQLWDRLSGTSSTGALVNIGGSSVIAVLQSGSIIAVPSGNQSVSGAVTVAGSVLLGSSNASVITVWQNSSVIALVQGSITAIPGGNQSVSGAINVSGSVLLGNSNASVITVWQNASIAGTYAEDSAHTTGDRGLFTLGVRNDNLSSVTSADGDYSPFTVGAVGEKIVANAPMTAWVQGVADLRVTLGASVQALSAPGASIFSYITGVQVANYGPSSVLVKFTGGLGSTLGWTIAPAGGGSNIVYANPLKTGANSGFSASINAVASVIVSAQGFTARI